MAFFNNKRKDFSIQPPRQQVDGTPFFVTDSANIDFTLLNLNLTANLTQLLPTSGTYGDATHIPILQIDQFGRITGVTTTTFSASGIELKTNDDLNDSQTILNLTSGTDIQVVDEGGGVIKFNYTGTGGTGTVFSVSAGTGMSFTTITGSGSVSIDTTKVPYLAAGFSIGLLKWSGSAWVFDTSTYLTTISGLNISLLTNDSGYITSAALTGYVPYTGATGNVNLGTFDLTATKLIKNGGVGTQFLKADGTVDNNVYLTSADLPSTLELFATTVIDPLIVGYTVLVRNITDIRYNTTAVDVPIGPITTQNMLVGSLISDNNIISGNPGLFDITTIGNIRRTSGTGQAEFYFRVYKRDNLGVETFITQSNATLPVLNGGYAQFSAIALWNNGIFLDTDRVVIKYYASRIVTAPVGSDPSFEFQFGGISPVRSAAAVPVAVIPNIFLADLADVEDVAPSNNETLYWNDTANLWEHSLVNDLVVATNSVQNISNDIQLVGDLLTPGNNKVYGTDASGTKGWKADPTGGGNSIGQLTGDVDTILATSSTEVMPSTLNASYKAGSAGVIFDGAGGVIATNTVAYAQVPYKGTITGWQIVANAIGGCTITVRRDGFGSFPPTTTIVTPVLLSARTSQSPSPLSIAVAAGDWLSFTISGVSTVAWVNLTLSITKTV